MTGAVIAVVSCLQLRASSLSEACGRQGRTGDPLQNLRTMRWMRIRKRCKAPFKAAHTAGDREFPEGH